MGIIVLTNQQSGAAFTAITNTIKDSYLGITGYDRLEEQRKRAVSNEANAKKITDDVWLNIQNAQKSSSQKPDMADYIGTYTDKWFGDVVISTIKGKTRFDSKRSPRLTGEVVYYKANTFVVKWDDRSLDADAFLQFGLDNTGKANSIKMNPISPLTDFSFDFQDLDFTRIK